MKILEKYTGTKTYMFANGSLATPEALLAQFPAALTFVHVIETDEAGEVCFAVENLSALRSLHGVDAALTEVEAIAALQEIINTPPAYEPDEQTIALSSIAAQMEYQNLLTMEETI